MTYRFKPLHSLFLAGLVTTLVGCGTAQSSPATDGHGAHGAHGSHGGTTARADGMGRHDPARMQAWMNQRLADLKTKLQITPAQEGAWNVYVAALQAAPRAPMAQAASDLSQLPTPERLDRMRALHTQHMAEMTARMDQRAEATKTFYAALSPAQKKTFDDAFSQTTSRGQHRGAMDGMGNMRGMGGSGHQAEHKHKHAS